MKFDTIIIGGGLSGLASGIKLAEAGKKVAILSAGQSTLHFHSGSFDLIGYNEGGKLVDSPFLEINNLKTSHPYTKVKNIVSIADEAQKMLQDTGLKVRGTAQRNHFRFTPMGVTKPAWLTLDDYCTTDSADSLPFSKVLLVNVAGFLDFPVEFISEGLEKLGARVNVKVLSLPLLQERRISPSEMRSANIAKILTSKETIEVISQKINISVGDSDVVLMPAIFGLNDDSIFTTLRQKVSKPLYVIATLPPSVPGVRVQNALVNRFKQLGGTYLMGHTAMEGAIKDNRVVGLKSSLLLDEKLEANNYILASGSFQSHGIVADYRKVYEPVFGVDVDFIAERTQWTAHDVFAPQAYMEFGVKTDAKFHALKDGASVENLFAVGSILAGHNSLKMADSTGVSLITALSVAKTILNL